MRIAKGLSGASLQRAALAALWIAVAGAMALGCGRPISEPDEAAEASASGERATGTAEARCDHYDPNRQVFWGDLHVHTGISSDAWRSDVRNRPADAYRFARGEAVLIPPLDSEGQGTQSVRLARPLDFAAVTDHAESFGLTAQCGSPESGVYDSPGCDYFRRLPATPAFAPDPDLPPRSEIEKMICGEDNSVCQEWGRRTDWDETKRAAALWDDASRTCRFSTFVAYEWSGSRDGPLLHRNVIFRNDEVPYPVDSRIAPNPGDLFSALETECLDSASGAPNCDVLSIPHNSNTSQGTMFGPVRDPAKPASIPAARRLAEQHARFEPVIEIMQHKGDSECRNGLSSVLGEPDELCDFEKLFPPQMPECRPGQVLAPNAVACTEAGSYARYGLAIGLVEKERLGVNPFEYGFLAATDTHNATPGQVGEASWKGHVGVRDDSPATRMGKAAQMNNALNNPGGLAGVWAEENSRASLFDAIRRRETFGTSGPRIAVRLFGGWDLPEDLCQQGDFAARAYATGVPMGSALDDAAVSGGSLGPRFAVQALADPGTAEHPGTDLERAQIVKVWTDAAGQIHQRVFDVAGESAAVSGGLEDVGVNLQTCEPTRTGPRSLCTVWEDPEFEAGTPAVYYARVVEQPSCRWTTASCRTLSGSERPSGCDAGLPKVVQERAWTSPIWVARKTGPG